MSNKIDIPSTLRKEEFRFIKVKKKAKIPIEPNWQKDNNYRFDDIELEHHIKRGGNYGVVTGFGNLVVVDCDIKEVENLVDEKLPNTFKVRTGSGGSHFYYICNDIEKPIRLTSGKSQGDVGDIQFKGKQVIGPKSIHPSGNRYQIENNGGISKIHVSDIKNALKEYIKNDVRKVKKEEEKRLKEKHDKDIDLSITDVVSLVGLEKRGSEYQGSHPIHGSKTGNNFCVNPKDNVWHCFRHDTGGGPLSWIAVKEGIIDCEDSVSGALSGNTFKEVLKVGKKKYGLDIDIGDLNQKLKEKLECKVFDLNRKSWNCRTKFVVFTKEIDFGDKEVKFPDTYELPIDLAEKLVDKNYAARGIWKCGKCGKFHYQKRKPYRCFNGDCDSEKFQPLHPNKYHEIGDCLLENYKFAVPLESIDENNVGYLHLYNQGVYKTKGVKGFLRQKGKMLNHKAKQTDLKHIINHIVDLTGIPEDRFGIKEEKVVLKEGVLDLNTLEIRPHNPDHYATSKIDVKYNPEAKCSRWKEYLKEVIPSKKDRIRLKELLGTGLVNDKLHKKAVVLVGPTDSGKSTFIEIIENIFDKDNCSNQSPHKIAHTRWATAKLRGKLLNLTDEVDEGKLHKLAILKKIIAGNKTEAERKGERTFEFKPYCEHIYAANQTPTANRKDDAFWNRWIVVEMPKSIPDDAQNPDLASEILEEKEGVFNWIVEGYRSFINNGKKFTYPIDWKEARDKWLNWGNSIQRFIQQCVKRDKGNKISTRELHQIYSDFAERLDLDVQSQKKLTQEVKKISYANYSENYRIDGRKQRGFKNIKIINTDNTDNSISYHGRKKENKIESKNIVGNEKNPCYPSPNKELEDFEDDKTNQQLEKLIIDFLKNGPRNIEDIIKEFSDQYEEGQIFDKVVDMEIEGHLLEVERGVYKLA